jgi:hypothetical protein
MLYGTAAIQRGPCHVPPLLVSGEVRFFFLLLLHKPQTIQHMLSGEVRFFSCCTDHKPAKNMLNEATATQTTNQPKYA